jgi:hypothetical protein
LAFCVVITQGIVNNLRRSSDRSIRAFLAVHFGLGMPVRSIDSGMPGLAFGTVTNAAFPRFVGIGRGNGVAASVALTFAHASCVHPALLLLSAAPSQLSTALMSSAVSRSCDAASLPRGVLSRADIVARADARRFKIFSHNAYN